MKRTNVTYGQLDKVLRSLGFSCRLVTQDPPPAYLYEHEATGADVILPSYPEDERVLEHHLASVRVLLEEFGIADPRVFDAKLRKVG